MNKQLLLLAAAALATSGIAVAKTAEPLSLDKPVTKVTKAADERTWKTLGEGEYSDAILSNLFRNFYNDPITVTVEECEQTPGVYRVVNPWPSVQTDETLYLEIDARDPEMVLIPAQVSPFDDPEWGETQYRSISDYAVTKLGFTKQQFLDSPLGDCNATMANNMITFPKNCLSVMWPNCDPYYGPSEPGVWTISNGEYPGYLVLPGAEGPQEWESIGMGKMLEGFLWPVFEPAGSVPVEKEVEILESKTTPGMYKIVKPFIETSPNGRDLLINATDPDFVKIPLQNTGVKSENGYTYILSLSATGYLSYEEMIAENPAYADRNITLKDGVMTMPRSSVLLNFPEYNNSIYDHQFQVDSYIKFPEANGIGSIDGTVDAPVEYFNLQGIRLDNPAPGQVVIIRQGNKVSKSIAR